LTARIGIAAAMLARAADERVIRLHPEDLALVGANLPEDWHFEPDSTLERGALRVEGAAGGVEDGPAQWRAALGFQGRLCIHPDQVGPANAAYSPPAVEVARAEKIVAAFAEAQAQGLASIQVDGRFVDYPIVERAQRVLAMAARIAAAGG
jgi:hypothetical protein